MAERYGSPPFESNLARKTPASEARSAAQPHEGWQASLLAVTQQNWQGSLLPVTQQD